MATSINYSSTVQGGKSLFKSITNISPNAAGGKIAAFTQKLNALTTNTLSSINRVDKTEIDPDITYHSVKLTVLVPDQYITFDDSTNTVTINAANMTQDTEASIGLIMNIQDGGATRQITNKPTIIDWAFGTNEEIAFYPMSGGTMLGISFIKSAASVSDRFTITLAGGSFTVNDTTYTYSPVTITIIINV